MTSADVDNIINVTFVDDTAWRNAISGVTINGTPINLADVNISAGSISFNPANISALQTPGNKTIVVNATGYSAATVVQTIGVGMLSISGSTFSVNPALAEGQTSAATIRTNDQYGNAIANQNLKYDIVIDVDDTDPTTDEAYTIHNRSVNGDITIIGIDTTSNTQGDIQFNITLPATVDVGDGVSVLVRRYSDLANIGSPITYSKQ
ncbi:hemoblobin-interacting domain-containing protein [Metabacillus fastidiosus]|uniref:hemoblobin-interacting domain-containing protein n=1 Tax=Metabacillus fastidiosus TaxID=1458 RepID=UPI003D2BBD95